MSAARLIAELELTERVRGVEQLAGDIVVALPAAVVVVRDGRLEPLIESIEVLALRGEYVLTPREIVKLDGTRLSLPALDGGVPRRFCPVAGGAIIALDDSRRPDRAVVLRIDGRGGVTWRTPIAPPSTGSVMLEFAQPWTPEQWNMIRGDLVLSHDRVLATFAEMPRSGIGICYGMDFDTGEIVYQLPPAPYGYVVPGSEPGWFLVGIQGYDSFETRLVDRRGAVRGTWPSHGLALGGDPVRILEIENVLPSRSHVSTLLPDGRVHHGAHLPGYHTSQVVVARDGGAVVWRDNALLYISPDGEHIEHLLQTPERGRPYAALAGRLPGRLALCWSTTGVVDGEAKSEHRLLLIDVSC